MMIHNLILKMSSPSCTFAFSCIIFILQVLQRIDDVSMMCEKRMTNLKRLTLKLPRPVQTVTPEPAVPLQQPPCCASDHSHNHHSKTSNKVFRKANTLPKVFVHKLPSYYTFFVGQFFIIELSKKCPHQTGWSSSNTLHLYLTGAWFESYS
jgi:hypothetical protein